MNDVFFVPSFGNKPKNLVGREDVLQRFDECLDGPYAIIYGHDMNDDSMFGSLKKYEEEEYGYMFVFVCASYRSKSFNL